MAQREHSGANKALTAAASFQQLHSSAVETVRARHVEEATSLLTLAAFKELYVDIAPSEDYIQPSTSAQACCGVEQKPSGCQINMNDRRHKYKVLNTARCDDERPKPKPMSPADSTDKLLNEHVARDSQLHTKPSVRYGSKARPKGFTASGKPIGSGSMLWHPPAL
eukprot:TRINITY_DN5582_c0_g1_i1.p1 TRINITY_DN5582_c0_g1~~TRINITY_DN5582_c0_g1_i1.p1  ORF type:complete len:186 (+),score=29.80 TRINITY_DN5582_c0_g1_i1:61-558(+)